MEDGNYEAAEDAISKSVEDRFRSKGPRLLKITATFLWLFVSFLVFYASLSRHHTVRKNQRSAILPTAR
jgi:hypothetical protein